MNKNKPKASPEELVQHMKSQKYATKNKVSQLLVKSFYKTIHSFINVVLNTSTESFLEVGCGPGESSLKLKNMIGNYHFEVSEFDDRLIEVLENTSFEIPFRQESVYDLQRTDNSFDCVFLLEVLEHLEDYDKALSELTRVSSKYVIISVPNEPIWRILNMMRLKYITAFGNTPGHLNHWTPVSFKKLLSKYGAVEKFSTPIPWQVALLRVK